LKIAKAVRFGFSDEPPAGDSPAGGHHLTYLSERTPRVSATQTDLTSYYGNEFRQFRKICDDRKNFHASLSDAGWPSICAARFAD
jgi:hypothetical protein